MRVHPGKGGSQPSLESGKPLRKDITPLGATLSASTDRESKEGVTKIGS